MTGKKKKKTKTSKSEPASAEVQATTKSIGTTIVIDESRGWAFNDEKEVYEHFAEQIEFLEKEYHMLRNESDTALDDLEDIDNHLAELLQEPDEVWLSEDVLEEISLGTFIGYYETESEEKSFYYIALTYISENIPKFVFLHFATDDLELIKKYQRGKKIYDRNHAPTLSDEEAIDALTEGNELAVGLYQAMIKLRHPTDIPEDEFPPFLKYREETIEEPDEIWRKIDTEGRVLVNFIKAIEDEDDTKYIVCTLEDEASESHYLLFSFPTKDNNLVDRFRQGEAMDTVSYSREESH